MKGVNVCSPNTLKKYLKFAIKFGLIIENEKGYVVKSLYYKKAHWRAIKVDKYIQNNKYWKDADKLLGKNLKEKTLDKRKKDGKATKSLSVKDFINIIQAIRVDAKLAACDYKYHKVAIRAGRTHDGFTFTLNCNPKKLKKLTSDVEKLEAYDNGLGYNKIAKVMGVCRTTAIKRMNFYCNNGMYKKRHNRKYIEELFDLDFCKEIHAKVREAEKHDSRMSCYDVFNQYKEFKGKRVIITNNNSILVCWGNSYIPKKDIREHRMCKAYYKKEVKKEQLKRKFAKKQNEENNKDLSSSVVSPINMQNIPY